MGAGCSKAAPQSSGSQSQAARPESKPEGREELQPVSAFSGISPMEARSVALFREAGRVITHPRCTNCHPPDDRPRQGMDQHVHVPAVSGGASGHGPPGLPCTACHQAATTPTVGATLPSIPGNPKWALAPVEMAWLGRPLGQICEQLKDPKRNGGKSLAEIQHHMAEDILVAWGWAPGLGLQPVPGTQKAFGELIQAWIDTGAHCPSP
ncbi:hypothetical protein [Hyalangium minutum]|uniref:Putative Isoquinoline 1-oxidoreductase subunit protein n=1 Tax=Hyalangium minutum TaxID=394096 RepID=A0A085WUV6_9BACT|nr:hypothetical protein [Hyalangium minutum]KFE71469.1 putative Isoquinoline 1-oxidoreductase subunit protein [Hyalangium minutum]